MRVQYSFVIDEDARFIAESRIFLRTILGAGIPPRDVVAQVTPRSGEVAKSLAAGFGVRAMDLPLGPDGKYCNKIHQLFTLADEDFDVLAICDTDLAITRPIDDAAKADVVRAKRVDQENPPLEVLEEIREFLGFPERPPLVAPGMSPAATTYALNCNGGVMLIPRRFMQPLGEAWLGYAQILTDHRQIMRQWVNHIDQVSWAFAMLKLALPFEELPVEYNFPTTLAKRIPPGTYTRPVVLHYHRAIDKRGRIRSSGVRLVDEVIKEANGYLRDASPGGKGTHVRWVLPTAGLLLALATVAGALGAHLLQGHWAPQRLDVYATAVRYHFYHSLGLLGIGLALRSLDAALLRVAAWLVTAGIILFSGSLYALTLGAPSALGVLTPIGGLSLIGGWLVFAYGIWRS